MIGRYLDALTDEYRDRAISAVNWRTGDAKPDTHGARCLVGHVEQWSIIPLEHDRQAQAIRYDIEDDSDVLVGQRFDGLAERFGLERTVRLIKQRAGRHNRVTVDQPQVETVQHA